jgi:DNA-binding MarR family transcriptional regulator
MLFTFRVTKLLDLVRRSSTIANRRLFDISGVEWRIVLHVGEHAPLSLNELADLIRLDRGQLSRAVKGLVERGLLDRRRRPGGPAVVITLSDEGKALHDAMITLTRERNEFLLRDISEEDIACTARVLAAVTHKAEMLLEEERARGLQPAGNTESRIAP